MKVRKEKENSLDHSETQVGSSREVSSITISTKVGLLTTNKLLPNYGAIMESLSLIFEKHRVLICF